jgi:hypothetical protein
MLPSISKVSNKKIVESPENVLPKIISSIIYLIYFYACVNNTLIFVEFGKDVAVYLI